MTLPELPKDIWNIVYGYLSWQSFNNMGIVSPIFGDYCRVDMHRRITTYKCDASQHDGLYLLSYLKLLSISFKGYAIKFRFEFVDKLIDKQYSIKRITDAYIFKHEHDEGQTFGTLEEALSKMTDCSEPLRSAFASILHKYIDLHDSIDSISKNDYNIE